MRKTWKVCWMITKWYLKATAFLWMLIGVGEFLYRYLLKTEKTPIDVSHEELRSIANGVLDTLIKRAINGWKGFFKIAKRAWF